MIQIKLLFMCILIYKHINKYTGFLQRVTLMDLHNSLKGERLMFSEIR